MIEIRDRDLLYIPFDSKLATYYYQLIYLKGVSQRILTIRTI